MIKCPQCGAENFPGMAYCEQCGTELPAPEAAAVPAPAAAQPPVDDTGAADAIAGAQALLDQLGDNPADAAPSAQQATHPVLAPDDVTAGAAGDDAQADVSASASPAPIDAPSAAPADAAVSTPPAPADAAVSTPPAPADAAVSTPPAPAPSDGAAAGFPQVALPLPTPVPTLTIAFADNLLFTLKQDVTDVGRADVAQNWHPELDVIPFGGGDPNFGVSRHQAVIRRDGSAFSVLDVGSTNGTYVNGRMLEYNKAAELHDGDTIAFGAFNGKVRIGA
jgi:pSer/pThr/pTyr-binding forkhead associated (FHA) protein